MIRTAKDQLLVAAEAKYLQPGIHYHEAEGIPKFSAIKQFEEGIDFDGGRIWGGQTVSFTAHPYLGGLIISLRNGRTSMCGSSLLTNTRSITAAHCWRTPTLTALQFTLVWGTNRILTGGFRMTSNDIVLHPNYNMHNLNSDVAIIRHRHMPFNYGVRQIRLAPSGLFDHYAGTWATAAGFGLTGDNDAGEANPQMREARLLVITNDECRETFGRAILQTNICASTRHGASTCPGDSGGPLVSGAGNFNTARLIGVKSFGAESCESGFPTAFSRISRFEPWIMLQIRPN